MKVKTYEGKDEQEILQRIKDDMGVEAVVLNIKKISPKGMFSFLKATKIEITAAIDGDTKPKDVVKENVAQDDSIDEITHFLRNMPKKEKTEEKEIATDKDYTVITLEKELILKEKVIQQKESEISKLHQKLNKSDELINNLTNNLMNINSNSNVVLNEYDNEYIQIMFDTLIEQNVMESVAHYILADVKEVGSENIDINIIVKMVYNKIIEIIGKPYFINPADVVNENAKVLLFMGPTGVGKTTTIAKLASKFLLDYNFKIGLITSDTYRIAAVDQLKMYANILNVELSVAYSKSDLQKSYDNMKENKNFIFIDTAGRSHKNEENIDELIELVNQVYESEKFLVISLTTKSEDIINIVNTYNKALDFKIIFSKSDETNALGGIINTCFLTGKQVSYITNGQIVPNDISIIEPEAVAKSILGLGVNDL